MSKTTVVVIAFLAGCGAAAVAPLVIPPAHAQTTQRWEMRCLYNEDRQPADTAEWFSQQGTRMGAEGWEPVVSGAGPHPGLMTVCFKRPAP